MKIKPRVVLCVPNWRWIDSDKNAQWDYLPYNLCLLAACIRDIADVSIIDAYKKDMSQDELRGALASLSPNLVGITVLMDKYGPSGHDAAKIAKELGCLTVMGGVYASMNAKEVMKDPNIDYVVKGEGEVVLRNIIQTRKHERTIIEANKISDLDCLPLPAYDLIDYPSYMSSITRKSVDNPPLFPYGRVLTSRGCPCHCCFCQVEHISGRAFRARSVNHVLDEIQWLTDTYGIKSLIFDDDNLLMDRGRASELFHGMIYRKLTMPWLMIATAAFKLDDSIIYLMKESGCIYVNVAIESGTDRILHEVIKKPVDLWYAKAMVQKLQEVGIYVAANFIIGFPTETWDEIRASLAFAEKLDADYTKIFAAMPLKHTRLWEMCEKEGAFKKDRSGEWSQGQIETEHFTANDLTILRAYEWERINFTDPIKRRRTCERLGVTEGELLKMRRRTLSSSHLHITT